MFWFFYSYQFVDGLQFGGIANSVRRHRSDAVPQIRIGSVTENECRRISQSYGAEFFFLRNNSLCGDGSVGSHCWRLGSCGGSVSSGCRIGRRGVIGSSGGLTQITRLDLLRRQRIARKGTKKKIIIIKDERIERENTSKNFTSIAVAFLSAQLLKTRKEKDKKVEKSFLVKARAQKSKEKEKTRKWRVSPIFFTHTRL